MDERARERGASLARWLNREASAIKHLDPTISYQGSFRLGTAIRPVGDKDAYDVDMIIKLRRFVAGTYSQTGRQAIVAGYTVLFTGAMELVANLAEAQADGRLEQRLTHFAKPKLLIVDELGYLPLEPDAAHLFFQLVSRRHEGGAMLIT